jgi:hypothetical protein
VKIAVHYSASSKALLIAQREKKFVGGRRIFFVYKQSIRRCSVMHCCPSGLGLERPPVQGQMEGV